MAPAPERIVDSWTRNADLWIEAVRTGKVRSRVVVTDAAIVRAALAHTPTHVLDLGCGEGWLCRALTKAGVRSVTGVDASATLIAAAEAAGDARFLCHSYDAIVSDPTIVGRGFDLVVANFALLDDRVDRLLAALASVTAPGSHLLIQTVHPATVDGPYEDGWRTEHFDDFDGVWTPMPWYFRTLASWLGALHPAWRLNAIEESVFVESRRPASLIIVAILER